MLAGGKKGLPWGALRSHKDISACKDDTVIRKFCDQLQATEYQSLAFALEKLLSVSRNRNMEFNEYHYFELYSSFSKILAEHGWTYDHVYDWDLPAGTSTTAQVSK